MNKNKKIARKVLTAVLTTSMVMTAGSSVFAAGPGAVTTTDVSEQEIASAKVSLQLATESAVLLENNNNVLPIAQGGDIALYGIGAVQTIKGGTGSGAVNNRIVYPDGSKVDGVAIASSVLDGFNNAGYHVITEDYLHEIDEASPMVTSGLGRSNLAEDTMLTAAQVDADAAQTDTAIYVVRRNAGEGADRQL